jgi:hypothetical protein
MYEVLVVRLTVPGLGALFAIVSGFFAIATGHEIHIPGLVAVLGNMTFLSTVATCSATSFRAVLREVTG